MSGIAVRGSDGVPRLVDRPERSPSPVKTSAEHRPDATEALTGALRERIMVLDGAMGTAIQRDRPDEAGYRGERFADWPSDLIGNNDLLTLTQPRHHRARSTAEYLEAGADIIETNTFNANAISLADYGLRGARLRAQPRVREARPRGRRRGRHRRPTRASSPARSGPTTRTASISPDVNDPGARNVSYDQLVDGVPRRGPRPRRRRRRPADDRDDLRHPQRQGGDLRGRDALRGAAAAAGR